ncbi:hypothetical protein ASD76_11515 [Altererythrobacter sp. Root672]|nr:hypothetical protein ASD76_11515 [Altererythrobacter sp. Root672]
MAAAGLQAQGGPGVSDIEKVSDTIYKIHGAGGNTTVFLRSDGVALVDTKLANNGEAILAQVRKVTDKPVTLIINTHSHGDHVGSNSEINPRGDIEVVAQANTSRRMAAMANVGAAKRTFEDRLTLGAGADRIELYWFGAGHTDGDAFVVFPAQRTMATGDIFQLLAMPRIDRGSGGSALALPDTLAKAQDTISGVDKVIDGHGTTVHDWPAFLSYVAFTRQVADAAREAEKAGRTPEQALAALGGKPELASFLSAEVPIGGNEGNTPRARALNGLTAAFQELRGEPPAPSPAPPPPANR